MQRLPRHPGQRLLLGALALCVWLTAPPARAVTFVDQIERLDDVYAGLLDDRPGAPPEQHEPGKGGVGAEIIPLPPIDNRVGAKHEPVQAPPAIPRLRADIGIGAGLSLAGVWIPTIPVQGFSASVVGASLDYGLAVGAFRAALRVFALQGSVTGPITDPMAHDTFTVGEQGVDGRLGWAAPPWIVYAGAGSGNSRTNLDVKVDGASARFSRAYAYQFAGVSREAGAWRFTAEQEQTESYLSHLVLSVRYGF